MIGKKGTGCTSSNKATLNAVGYILMAALDFVWLWGVVQGVATYKQVRGREGWGESQSATQDVSV